MKKFLLVLVLVATSVSCGAPRSANRSVQAWEQQAAKVTIVRDDWGIPHVYGETDADAVFGMIYAQAEDDFKWAAWPRRRARQRSTATCA